MKSNITVWLAIFSVVLNVLTDTFVKLKLLTDSVLMKGHIH